MTRATNATNATLATGGGRLLIDESILLICFVNMSAYSRVESVTSAGVVV